MSRNIGWRNILLNNAKREILRRAPRDESDRLVSLLSRRIDPPPALSEMLSAPSLVLHGLRDRRHLSAIDYVVR